MRQAIECNRQRQESIRKAKRHASKIEQKRKKGTRQKSSKKASKRHPKMQARATYLRN